MSEEEFVTVVSVEDAPYVTVVEVQEPLIRTTETEETSAVPPSLQEDIQIYRLPGERLGFGLKFDGGPTVSSLTVESTAEGSPSARARASWGPLAPGDCILAVDGRPVAEMSRQEVVTRLTESGLVVKLRVGRGPPPVPPRRQSKRTSVAGPPPPPRPLPRAPPRLVHFLPKDSLRLLDAQSQETDLLMNTSTETPHEVDNTDGKDDYIGKEGDAEFQAQLEDDLKEKIIPLKNLNPKLISLFEHSQPSDNNVKTSQNLQNNNKKFWLNDDKSRKSVKDKIALFSSEVENNFEKKTKKMEFNEQNKTSKMAQKVLETTFVSDLESNNNLSNRIKISENIEITNKNVDFIQMENGIDVNPIVPLTSQNIKGGMIANGNVVSLTVNSVPSLQQIQFQTKDILEEKQDESIESKENLKKDGNSKVICNSNILPESRKKSMVCKEKASSKLRGLVIPQTPSKVPSTEQILDLPEIKSSALFSQTELFDSISVTSKQEELPKVSDSDTQCQLVKPKFQSTVTIHEPSLEWNSHFENELPKYSPAFKRKALSVFEIRSNCADNYLVSDNEKSQNKLGKLWNFPLNNQQESILDYDNTVKESVTGIEKLSMQDDYSPSYNYSELEKQDAEFKNNLSTKVNCKKDDYIYKCNANSLIISKENNSEPNSLTSHNSVSSNTVEHEKSKHFRDGKLDSLLSQDMSDSGNHSIPSNCSKYKSDSSDESLSSLVNSDSDHVSLNSSSDEGQFIEFSYNNSNSKNERSHSNEKNIKTDSLSSLVVDSNKTKSIINSFTPEPPKDDKECLDINNKSCEVQKKNKEGFGNSTWTEEKNNFLMNKTLENAENSSVFPIKVSLNGKINPSTLNYCKQPELKDYNNDILSKDSIIDENIVSLNSPVGDLQKENHFASITSLASSTSLISHQELCQLIEESNDSSMDDNNGTPDISVIVLHRDSTEGSIGITLAGGVDYECKDIMVHKVLSGSPADKDGRIKKGHRILSINGKSMKGLTHAESLAVLKAPRHEVVLVVARSQGYLFEENNNVSRNCLPHPPEQSLTPASSLQTGTESKWGPIINVTLLKEGAGLGFSLKGGKDSPSGDQALTVQKIFTGGCAEKSKQIFAGDELLSINEFDLNGMTRVEAWTLMKRLPDGKITLKIRHSAL